MGNILSIAGDKAWENWPWNHWNPIFVQARMLPTFMIAEGCYHWLAYQCFKHAWYTGNTALWVSGILCGTANDIFFMWLPVAEQFWQGQAIINLTPRLPLYILSMYATVVYVSTTAARRLGFGYLPEAALTGLLAHVFYNVYDTNGPRYLWWTWHDGDPAISVRNHNAPTASSIWVLTYMAWHSILARWVNDPQISLNKEIMENFLRYLPLDMIIRDYEWKSFLIEKLSMFLQRIDKFHSKLIRFPNILKIAFCGTICTPLFMISMGQLSIFSLDKIGIPGYRSYRFCVLLYTALVWYSVMKGKTSFSRFQQPGKYIQDIELLKWIVVHFAVHSTIALFGRPKTHVSLGCHQRYGERDTVIRRDLVWLKRDDLVSGSGPHANSRFDYRFPTKEEAEKFLTNAEPIIMPSIIAHHTDDDKTTSHHHRPDDEWYTVFGIDHKSPSNERVHVLLMSVVGILSYSSAFLSQYS